MCATSERDQQQQVELGERGHAGVLRRARRRSPDPAPSAASASSARVSDSSRSRARGGPVVVDLDDRPRPVGALGRRSRSRSAPAMWTQLPLLRSFAPARRGPTGLAVQRPAAVGVAEDDVLGLDPQALDDLAHRRQPGPRDRARGEVGLDRAQAEAVGDPDRPRQRDRAQQPARAASAPGWRRRSSPPRSAPTGPGRGARRSAPWASANRNA